MSRTQIFSLLFFVLTVTAYSILEWHHTKQEDIQVVENNITPDFIAESLKSEAFSQKGLLTYRIDASRMEHYSELAVTHFEFPKYTLYPKDSDAPWKISANEGTLYNSNRVKLENKVLLISTDENSLIREIHGKYLELDLNTNIISSENSIRIKGVDFAMQGTGLIIDLNTKQVTLTQHEQTIYQPSTH
ncbi:LPS export ABC transporter periplasmic protein LptC [Thalassotalea sediminis]|uniref:LPS export ABC transporter periplasmic protein LptC n=1 Tax=Thalassotalea sediminis TaxID=1759089 RepID=UPI0025736C83|nr:LPS export ABC transporter periplasmic protein LptC [Thalassotalea sediminis]